MPTDGLFLSLLAAELRGKILGAKTDKLFQPTRDEIVLVLRGRTKDTGGRLLISARTASARVHLTESAPENPAVPPMFCMLLRKKLLGSVLSDIRQQGADRVLYLDFDGYDELGEKTRHTLVAELLGRAPNLILTDREGKIVDALRRTSADVRRPVMPGAAYEPPPPLGKPSFAEIGTDELLIAVRGWDGPLSEALRRAVDGLSPAVCRELAYRTLRGDDRPASALTPSDFERLRFFLNDHKDRIRAGGEPWAGFKKDGTPLDFSYIPLKQYGTAVTEKTYASYSQLLDAFYLERDRKARLQSASAGILKVLTSALERTAKKLRLRREELESTRDREDLRVRGELLKASLHQIPRGAPFAEVPNYYDPDCPTVRIELDPALSPADNAKRYFKLYRKAVAAEQTLSKLIDEAEKELRYLESVFDALARASSEREIEEIKDELTQTGYLGRHGEKRGPKKPSALPPLRFEHAGFEILVGRNNRQNDELTFKTADDGDLWFHVKTIPGSHVILRTDGRTPPDEAISEAARLAARHSSAKPGMGIEVDYTRVRYVKKPPGAKPGMVTYDRYATVFVRPDENGGAN